MVYPAPIVSSNPCPAGLLLLGLGYPGGPKVEARAKAGDAKRFKLPRPMRGRPGCDFSFSGLKTAVRRRIEALGGTLAPDHVIRCGHNEDEVAAALARLRDAGCGLVMACGASAIVDRRDIIPAAITRTGGEIDHFGMPVDPGNLILLAHRGPVPVLGLPGCARSPAFNGFDWILQRLFAGLPLGGPEVMGMGAGGLHSRNVLRTVDAALAHHDFS